jgi:ABC-type nickel/cobalt efflux system permease component RcnA
MIQKFALFLFVGSLIASCSNSSGENANATNSNEDTTQVVMSFYPDTSTFDVSGAISVADLKAKISNQDSLMVKVSATITETCTRMGCWMDIKDEAGEDIKVRMKDHNFFVPKDGCEGKKCVIEGYAYRTTFTEEERLHYAEESNMSAEEIAKIKGPQDVLTITAHRVMIEDAPVASEEEHNHDHDHDHEGHDHDHEGHEHHDHSGETKDVLPELLPFFANMTKSACF